MNAIENAVEQPLPLTFAKVLNADDVAAAGKDWLGVSLDDYQAALAGVPPGADLTPLTRDDNATRQLLQHVLDVVAEVEEDAQFAGFQLQEMRNDEGKLLAVRLVACDHIAGVVSPRVA